LSIDLRIHLLNSCIQVRRALEDLDLCIVHHWDVDGVASSAIVAKIFNITKFCVPKIGCYGIECIGTEHSRYLILDYGIAPKRSVGIVGVVDHHRVELSNSDASDCVSLCNPVALGRYSENDFPSTTWVLARLILTDREADSVKELVALGIVGDIGSRVASSSWLELVVKAFGSVDRALRVARIVDACYQRCDYSCIDYVRRLLVECGVECIEEDSRLLDAHREIEEEFKKVLRNIVPIYVDSEIEVFRARSRFFITSRIGRYLADRNPDKVVVVLHHVEGLNEGFLYIRSHRRRLTEILHVLRALRYNAGGKDFVVAAICRDPFCNDVEELVETLVGILHEKSTGFGSR